MLKLKYKRILSLIMATVLCISLAGCGDKNADKNQVTKKDESLPGEMPDDEKTASGDEKVTIRYSLWGNDDREEYTVRSISNFMKLYPDITVKIECEAWKSHQDNMDELMAEGDEADVIQMNYNWLGRYSPDGQGFYDLKELSDIIDLSEFSDECLSYGMSGGKLNGIPVSLNTATFMYNSSLYKSYGLEVPETWSDIFRAASVMKEDGVYPLIMDKYQAISLMSGYYEQMTGRDLYLGNEVLNPDKKALMEAVEFYKSLYEAGAICLPADFSESMLEDGRAAGIVCWTSAVGTNEKRMEKAGGKAALGNYLAADKALESGKSSKSGRYVKPSMLLGISVNTSHPKEAALLVEYLLNSSENAILQGSDKGIPASKSAEMALMEAGELNTLAYRAKIMLDYEIDVMSKKSELMEQEIFADVVVYSVDAYIKGEMTAEEAMEFMLRQVM